MNSLQDKRRAGNSRHSRYEIIDHTADMGVLIYGDTPEHIFTNAAMMLSELMVDRLPRPGREQANLSLEGMDRIDLLIRWLSEILYFFEVEEKIVTGTEIHELTETTLDATLSFAPFDFEAHGVRHQIKAATYHQAEFKPFGDGWRARIIFDL